MFWRNHDPFAKDRQFCDRGDQYRPGVFYHNEEQRQLAERQEDAAGAVQAADADRNHRGTTFYKAEDYHQDYYKKNPSAISSTGSIAAAIPAWKSCSASPDRAMPTRRFILGGVARGGR